MSPTPEHGLNNEQLRVVYETARQADRLHITEEYRRRLADIPLDIVLGPQRRPDFPETAQVRLIASDRYLPLMCTVRPVHEELVLQLMCVDTLTGQPFEPSRLTICCFEQRDTSLGRIMLPTQDFANGKVHGRAAWALSRLTSQAAVGLGEAEPTKLLAFRQLLQKTNKDTADPLRLPRPRRPALPEA